MARYLQSAGLLAVLVLGMVMPGWLELFTVYEITIYLIMAVLALSLAFVWGKGGIMCLGQAAFFGLGAYAWAVAATNFGPGLAAVAISVAVPALFAAVLGYFMFYGRINDIYIGVITLAVTLILFNLINSTSGPQYRIGTALLGGFNGMTGVPTLAWPNGMPLDPGDIFRLTVIVLVAGIVAISLYLKTTPGKVTIAVRENEYRAELLGYNVAQSKLIANWGAFVSPTIFSLVQSAQIIIWVIVGGRGTLIGPILGCIALQWATTKLGTQQVVQVNLVLGVVLAFFVLVVPQGIVPMFTKALGTLFGRKTDSAAAVAEATTTETRP
jgi:branched-chain amino acid transport system permease protein